MGYIGIKDIEKYFGKNKVLNRIDLEIEKGEFVSLLGPSGCGKTTLLRIISGLEKQSSGKILVEGENISSLSPSKRNIGIVFQNYVLFPNMTVFENIAYGLVNRRIAKSEIEEKVKQILIKVDLLHIKDKYPKQLSGGQQQRVALARAVILEPNILLLDEPLSALDAKVRESLRREIKKLQKELGITTIMVTHDQEEALTMSDKIVVMNNANIMQVGCPEEIYKNPANEFVAEFIGTINVIEEGVEKKTFRPEEVFISNKERDEYRSCTIKEMEYRGPFYRLIVETDAKAEIAVDISSSTKEEMDLKNNSKIFCKIG